MAAGTLPDHGMARSLDESLSAWAQETCVCLILAMTARDAVAVLLEGHTLREAAGEDRWV